MNFSFYTVDTAYCDFLRKTDSCIPYTMDKKSIRPFVGIVFSVNDFHYYAPLTSPKSKHLHMKNQIDFLKIKNGEWGAINFNNMIPVPLACLAKVELSILESDMKQDVDYKNLLSNQLSWCNSHKDTILRQAEKLYHMITHGNAWKALAERCCDFPLDEQQCLFYEQKNHRIDQAIYESEQDLINGAEAIDAEAVFARLEKKHFDECMTSKSEQLEQLFMEWEYAQENESDFSWERTRGGKNITKRHFRRDGIIDEAVFSKEKRKVLFISNEANDDEYSAKSNPKPSNIDDYRKYYETGYDDWLGKMRERTSAIYKVIAEIGINEMSDSDAAIHYAVMDLNKRGGGADVKGALHIQEYCKYYKEFIKKEIEIINPDVVVWLGTKTYDIDLHINYLGAKRIGDKIYFLIDDKQIPILRMWHTSFYQGKIEPLQGYSNRIIGKLCAKCREEMKRYNLI